MSLQIYNRQKTMFLAYCLGAALNTELLKQNKLFLTQYQRKIFTKRKAKHLMTTETTNKNYEVELTTRCTCTVLDDDAEFDIENYKPAEYCFGDCYEMALEDINDYWLTKWQKANGFNEDTIIRLNGYRMGWQSRNGHIDVPIKT